MSNLVFARNGQALTSSVIIAENTGNTHKAIIQLVRGYLNDFETFGRVGFEIQPFETNGGVQKREIAILNEQQATLLVTYCKNTETVRKFKVALVKAFYEMREQLHPQCPAQAQLPPPTLTEQQAYAIMSKVAMRAKRDGAKYQTIYRALKARYQVTKYTNIPRDKFDDAIEFICTVDLRTPEVPEPEPKQEPETNHGVLVSPEFCEALRLRVYYERYVFGEYYERFYRFLQLVDSPLAGRFHEIRTSINLINLERQLAKVGFPVDDILNFKRTPRPNAIVAR